MKKFALLVLLVVCLFPALTFACTGIITKTQDNNYVYARTLEFGNDVVTYNLLFVPRNYSFVSQTPSGEAGLAWKTSYAHIGFNPYGLPKISEGVNEKGLACGGFFHDGYAKYQTITPADYPSTISCLDLGEWILGTCATVAEVRAKLPTIKVGDAKLAGMGGIVPPLHLMVVDKSGDAIIVEYLNSQLCIFSNEANVITNSPTYDWQVTNLRNYIGLKPTNNSPQKINGYTFAQFGQGSGGIGLPGDFSSPSRFVRAAYLANVAFPGKNISEGINNAFHILNHFDIPMGAVRGNMGSKEIYDVAQWTDAIDLTNSRIYYHTYADRSVKMVDLMKFDLNGHDLKTFTNLQAPGRVIDITSQVN